MGSHPVNLALRFALELAALASMGFCGYRLADGAWSVVFAVGIPLLAAILWGVFAVPADPSRSGRAPIPVPGAVRLMLEFAFFGFACWALVRAGEPRLGLLLAVVSSLHYAMSYDRIRWLLQR